MNVVAMMEITGQSICVSVSVQYGEIKESNNKNDLAAILACGLTQLPTAERLVSKTESSPPAPASCYSHLVIQLLLMLNISCVQIGQKHFTSLDN